MNSSDINVLANSMLVGKVSGNELASKRVRPFTVDTAGKIVELPIMEAPDRIQQVVTLDDVESFISYVNEFKTPSSRVFVKYEANGSFVAVLDYHTKDKPSFGTHRVHLPLKMTPEFKAWHDIHGKIMLQAGFADFLEDNVAVVKKPAAADLIQIARTLQSKKEVKFTSSQRLDNGDFNLAYSEESTATAGKKGNLEIPTKIELFVPMFEGAIPTAVGLHFRHRINDGALTFEVKIMQLDRLIKGVIDTTSKQILDETGVDVFKGALA